MSHTNALCDDIVTVLDQEYHLLQTGHLDSLAEINEKKLMLIPLMQEALASDMAVYGSLPQILSDKLEIMQKKSHRNSQSLKVMMDASRIVVNAIQEAHNLSETGGTYQIQGAGYCAVSVNQLFNRELGSA